MSTADPNCIVTLQNQLQACHRIQEQFLAWFEQPAVAIAHRSLEGTYLRVNQRFCTILGYEREDLLSLAVQQITQAEDWGVERVYLQQLLDGSISYYSLEQRYLRRDGSHVWGTLTVSLVRSDAGEPLYLIMLLDDISERKRLEAERQQAQEELQRSETLHRLILNSISDAVFITNDVGHLTFICPNVQAIFGYSYAEVEQMGTIHALVGEELVDDESLTRQGEIPNIERTITDKSGQLHTLLITVKRVSIAGGTRLYTCREISDRKQTELALRDSESRLSRLISNLPGYVYRVANDLNYTPEFISEGVTAITGYDQREYLIDRTISCGQEIHPDDVEAVWGTVQTAIAAGQPYECTYRILTKTGQQRWVWERGRGILSETGELHHLEGFVTDISDRKRAEAQSAFQASILDQVRNAVIVTDLTGRITYWNQFAQQLYQFTPAVMGRPILDVTVPGDSAYLAQSILEAIQAQGSWEGEFIVQRQDGTTFPAYVVNTLIRDVDGNPCGFVGLSIDITYRKKAEESLRKSEAMNRAIRDALPDLMIRMSRNGTYLDFKPAKFPALMPYEPMQGINIHDVLPEELAEQRLIYAERAIQTGEPQSYEFQVVVDGQLRWQECRIVVSGDDEVLVLIRDISDRKQAEAALQNLIQGTASVTGQDFFPTLVEHIAHALHVRHVIVSELIEDQLHSLAFWSNNYLQPELTYYVAKTPCEMALTEGSYCCPIQVQALFPDDRDLALLQAESYLGIAMQTHEGTAIGNLCILDDKPLVAPERAEAILRVFAARATAELERNRALEALKQFNRDLEFRVEERTAELQTRELELRQTNAELARATRLKDEFLANMSHELRNPLAGILGLSQLLLLQARTYGMLSDRQRKAVVTIEQSGRHLLALINDILDLAKIESGKMELNSNPVEIQTLCQSSLTFVKQQAVEKRIQLIDEIPEGMGAIAIDELRMRQVLINLLSNAIKFTPVGGMVTLRVWLQEGETSKSSICYTPNLIRGSGNAATLQIGNSATYPPLICFSIFDTGIGIAPDDMGKLFQSFVQLDSRLNRSHSGTGLGLALVRRIIEMHEGYVEVESVLGYGSCFTVKLPYPTPLDSTLLNPHYVAETPDIPIALLPTSYPPPLILLVEDDEANRETMTAFLDLQGYRLAIACNGVEAVHLAKTKHPDLILMDIRMPEMDGLTAIRQIRSEAKLAETPIIALTALAMVGDCDRCLEAGATHYLTKPITIDKLGQAITRFLVRNINPT